MILTFNADTHTYYGDGKPIPSVTQILRAAGVTGHYRGTTARDRGSRVHEATEMYDALGIIADSDEAAYVRAWARFCSDNQVEILASEQAVFNEEHWYAGTLDRIVRIKGDQVAILDIKSGAKADWHRMQLAAYALCWPDPVDIGLVVYLKPEKYSVALFTKDHMTAATNHWLQIRSVVK